MNQDVTLTIVPGQKLVLTITIEAVPRAYEDVSQKPTLENILLKVSDVAEKDIQSIISESKKFEVLIPRYAFCHIAHKVYGYSLKATASMINRDHTTVMNACNEFKNLREQNIPDAVMLIKKLQQHFPVVL